MRPRGVLLVFACVIVLWGTVGYLLGQWWGW